MSKNIVLIYFVLLSFNLFAQDADLPNDVRPHLITQFNASLLNPTYSLNWNNQKSLSAWGRWQEQNIDDSPTTTFINYTHVFSPDRVAAVGFLQNNTGVFLNTGGIINYAQTFSVSKKVTIALGANLYVFQQELANEVFTNPNGLEQTNEYLAQISPGIRLNVNTFNLALSLENAIDYNFSQTRVNNGNRVITAVVSNDFNFSLFSSDKNSFVRPIAYVRRIPDFETQFGGNLLLSTPNFWLQGGYNSFYGASGGLGITFFKKLSLGGIVEFDTDTEVIDRDLTFELVASYHIGKAKPKRKKKKKEEEEKAKAKAEAKAQEKARALEEQKRLAAELIRKEDSIASVKKKELELLREKQRLDSIAKVEQTKEVEVLPNEKYEEVTSTSVDGLEPGFYLIANVFGTKKYFEAFLITLRNRGLSPKSFYRSENTYNYVYLERYNTIEEARSVRNSNFNGRYQDKLWIFRVRGD